MEPTMNFRRTEPPFLIAEIGINHNGDLNIAKQLIDLAFSCGCNAVKFQKSDVDQVYSREELSMSRENPFGSTNEDLKRHLEFGVEEYDEINRYCNELGIDWFASAWDPLSQDFLRRYDIKYNKVASPMLNLTDLIEKIAEEGKHTFVSTGMSTLEEIDRAVDIFHRYNCSFELMHCNSSYPTENGNANLRVIQTLKNRYQCPVGFSGHEKGIQITLAAVALGLSSVERHITLDKYMYGSDQLASLPPSSLTKLSSLIEIIHNSMGDGEKFIREEEKAPRDKLSKPGWSLPQT